MTIPLLFLLAALESPQQVEQQIQRQQLELQQIQRALEQQMSRLMEVLERQTQQGQHAQSKPVCSAEIRWVNSADPRRVPASATAVVPLSLFSTISQPEDGCLQGEIRVTASYLDPGDNLVCSGVVDNVAIQSTLTQSINLEIRPWNLREFVRWRNEPPQTNSGPRRLVCLNPEGTSENTSEEMDRAVSIRVRATVLPRGGGLSTAEIRLNLQR